MPKHRKIPGRKHRGVKDPEAQRSKREQEIKCKVNQRPSSEQDQEVPRKLRMIADQKAGSLSKKPRKKKTNASLLDSARHMGYESTLPGMTRPLKPIPVFQQGPGESKSNFFRRVGNTVEQYVKMRNYEVTNNVELVQDQATGQTKFREAPKDELEEMVARDKAAKLAKKGILLKSKEDKRKQRRLKEKERKAKKKRHYKKQDDDVDRDSIKKPVPFNDVVHAPPKLNPPRNACLKESRQQLLLVKKMSLARRQHLNAERERVIEQYRLLKKNQT